MPVVSNQLQFVRRLDERRRALKLSHNAVCSDAGLSTRVLEKVQTGETQHLRMTAAFALLDALGLEMDIRVKPSAKERRLELARQERAGGDGADEPAESDTASEPPAGSGLPNLEQLMRVPMERWAEVEALLAEALTPKEKPGKRWIRQPSRKKAA